MNWNRFLAHLWMALCAVLFCCGMAGRGQAQEPVTNPAPKPPVVLTNAEQVHRLTREEAERGVPALIRGVVICALPEFQAVVIQDSTRGIYVDHLTAPAAKPPQIGEEVEIEGVTQPGEFAPSVQARRVTRLGEGALPQPIHPAWDQLINGSLDSQYVEIQAIITSVQPGLVTLITHGGRLKAPLGGLNAETLTHYENCLIQMRGCLFASWDPATHQVRPGEIRMYAPAVTVLEPAPQDVFAGPTKRVRELLLFDPQASALRRV